MPQRSKFVIGKDEIVHKGRYFDTVRRHFRSRAETKPLFWEMVDRKTKGRIVSIIGLTPRREIILTKTYRIPMKSWIIEACAGLADRKGESEEALARRELLEETGYAVSKLEKLVAGPFNAGLLHDEIVTFIGFGAKRVRPQKLEISEDIRVLKIPFHEARYRLLHPPKGVRVDMKIFAALYFIEERISEQRKK